MVLKLFSAMCFNRALKIKTHPSETEKCSCRLQCLQLYKSSRRVFFSPEYFFKVRTIHLLATRCPNILMSCQFLSDAKRCLINWRKFAAEQQSPKPSSNVAAATYCQSKAFVIIFSFNSFLNGNSE